MSDHPRDATPSEPMTETRLCELLDTVRYSDFPHEADEATAEIVAALISKSDGLRPCGCTLDKDGRQVDECSYHLGLKLERAERFALSTARETNAAPQDQDAKAVAAEQSAPDGTAPAVAAPYETPLMDEIEARIWAETGGGPNEQELCAVGRKLERKLVEAKRENARLLDAVCVGNIGCELKARCQSYEASEQSAPCLPGRCVMAEEDDAKSEPAAAAPSDLEILRIALGNTAACLGDALATFNRVAGEEVFKNAAPQAASTPATAYVPESDPVAEVSEKPAPSAPSAPSAEVRTGGDKDDFLRWVETYRPVNASDKELRACWAAAQASAAWVAMQRSSSARFVSVPREAVERLLADARAQPMERIKPAKKGRMMTTIKECCGERCKFTTSFRSPVARVMLCGRELTQEEIDRAKLAFVERELHTAAGSES